MNPAESLHNRDRGVYLNIKHNYEPSNREDAKRLGCIDDSSSSSANTYPDMYDRRVPGKSRLDTRNGNSQPYLCTCHFDKDRLQYLNTRRYLKYKRTNKFNRSVIIIYL